MPVAHVTLHLPDDLWHGVHALAPHECDANTVVLRALEEYVTAAAKHHGTRSRRYRDLLLALSAPVADLNLSARLASALQMLHIRHVYELVQHPPTDHFKHPNVGHKSLKEITDKPAAVGLALDMTVEDDAYQRR